MMEERLKAIRIKLSLYGVKGTDLEVLTSLISPEQLERQVDCFQYRQIPPGIAPSSYLQTCILKDMKEPADRSRVHNPLPTQQDRNPRSNQSPPADRPRQESEAQEEAPSAPPGPPLIPPTEQEKKEMDLIREWHQVPRYFEGVDGKVLSYRVMPEHWVGREDDIETLRVALGIEPFNRPPGYESPNMLRMLSGVAKGIKWRKG